MLPTEEADSRMNGAKALFSNVMEDSTNTSVDPRACIPLTKVRETAKSGVMRLKRIFKGTTKDLGSATTVGESIGFIAGSDNPIIIPLQGTYARCIIDHFVEDRNMSQADAVYTARSRDIWYGVVDGVHRLYAIRELMEEDPERWDGFSWPVTILKGGHPLQVLKQLARHQNIKQSQNQFVETTFYDQMKGLKSEAQRLTQERNGKKPSSRDIADAYDGCSGFTDRTMQQMASTAIRLPDEVISVLGEIINSEHPEHVELPGLKRIGKDTAHSAEIMSTIDCRVYRRFINITSLKQATVFMRGGGSHGVAAQINALYRCKEVCKQNGFKPVSYRAVSEQYKKAIMALDECCKFECLMESEEWPYEMETMKKNLLRSTKFDEEISRNSGNEKRVLHSLVQKYKLVCPALAAVKMHKYNATISMDRNPSDEDVEAQIPNSGAQETSPLNCSMEDIPGTDAPNNGDPSTVEASEEIAQVMANSTHGTEPNKEGPGSLVHPTDSQGNEEQSACAHSVNDEADVISTAASERLKRSDVGVRALESLHIECHQMRWQEYDKSILEDDTPLFDMVLTDPPYGVPDNPARAGTKYKNYLDEEEMKRFSQFCRRVLLPGGYCFTFTSAKYFYPWVAAFREAGFKVCEYPFILNKDSSGLQGTRLEDFPQNSTEFAVMTRAPGKSSTSFRPDFRSPYHMFQCNHNRRFASLINAPVQTRKLTNGATKSPLLVEEKNPKVLAEIITTFSPVNARIIDCYGGTFTTAMAAVMTRRQCVCIEMSAEIYRFAMERLCTFAQSYEQTGTKEMRTENASDVHTPNPSAAPSASKSVTKIQEPVQNNSTPEARTLVGNMEVILLLGKADVGRAVLQSGNAKNRGPIVRSLHGRDLSDFESPNEDLVVILKVQIDRSYAGRNYPYNFSCQDGVPVTLGDIHPSGVYAWDANAMRAA